MKRPWSPSNALAHGVTNYFPILAPVGVRERMKRALAEAYVAGLKAAADAAEHRPHPEHCGHLEIEILIAKTQSRLRELLGKRGLSR